MQMEALVQALEQQAAQLRDLTAFRYSTDTDLCLRLVDVATKVSTLSDVVMGLRAQLRAENESLALLPDAKQSLMRTNERLRKFLHESASAAVNSPSFSVPKTSPTPTTAALEKENSVVHSVPDVKTAARPVAVASSASLLATKQHAPSWAAAVGPTTPAIAPVTVEEFEHIPKYMMKGRLTVDKLNEAITNLVRVYEEKYKVMRLAPSKMKDVTRRRYQAYQAAETDDTNGLFFVVDDDIREHGGSLKTDPQGRSIMIMLRHLGRLREIRTGGLLRYVIV